MNKHDFHIVDPSMLVQVELDKVGVESHVISQSKFHIDGKLKVESMTMLRRRIQLQLGPRLSCDSSKDLIVL